MIFKAVCFPVLPTVSASGQHVLSTSVGPNVRRILSWEFGGNGNCQGKRRRKKEEKTLAGLKTSKLKDEVYLDRQTMTFSC